MVGLWLCPKSTWYYWGFSQNRFFEQVKYHKWTVTVNGSTKKNKITNKTGGSMIYFCV